MVMKPIRKCRRNEAKSRTLPTVAEESFWVELQFIGLERKKSVRVTAFFPRSRFSL